MPEPKRSWPQHSREVIFDLLEEGYEICYEWQMDGVVTGSEYAGALKILHHLAGNHHYKGSEMYTMVIRNYRKKWIDQMICPDCKTKLRYNLDHGIPYCDQCDREWG